MDNETADAELTSSMGSVLSPSNKDDKNDASDSTPTSSTDAHNSAATSQILTDDPISSTSSDIQELKAKEAIMDKQFSLPAVPASRDRSEITASNSASLVSDADLLYMNITDVSDEKITEDVEDIVQDLENLLGESSSFTTSHGQTTNLEETSKPSSIENESLDIEERGMDIDSVPLEAKPLEIGDKNVTTDTESKLPQLDMEQIIPSANIAEMQNIEQPDPNIEQIEVPCVNISETQNIQEPHPNIEEMDVPGVNISETQNIGEPDPNIEEMEVPCVNISETQNIEEPTANIEQFEVLEHVQSPVQEIISEGVDCSSVNPETTELDAAIQGILDNNFPVSDVINIKDQAQSSDGIQCEQTVSIEVIQNDDAVTSVEPNEVNQTNDEMLMDVDTAFEDVSSQAENIKAEGSLLHPEKTHVEVMQIDEDFQNTPGTCVEKVDDVVPEEFVSESPPKCVEQPEDTVISDNIVVIQEDNQSQFTEDNIEKFEVIQPTISEQDTINVIEHPESNLLVEDISISLSHTPKSDELLNTGVEPKCVKKAAYVCGPDGPDEVKEADIESSILENAQIAGEQAIEKDIAPTIESSKTDEKSLTHSNDGQEFTKESDDAAEAAMSQEGKSISMMEHSFERTPLELPKEDVIDTSAIKLDLITEHTSSDEYQASAVQTNEIVGEILQETASIEQDNHDMEDFDIVASIEVDKAGGNEIIEEVEEIISTEDAGDLDLEIREKIDETDKDVDESDSLNKEAVVVEELKIVTSESQDVSLAKPAEDTQIQSCSDVDKEETAMLEDVQISSQKEIICEQGEAEKVDVETSITISKDTDTQPVKTNNMEDVEMTQESKMDLFIDKSLQDEHPSNDNKEQSQNSSAGEDAVKAENITESSGTLEYIEDTRQDDITETTTETDTDVACKSDEHSEPICPGTAEKSEISNENQLSGTTTSSILQQGAHEHNVLIDTTAKTSCPSRNVEPSTNIKQPLSVKIDDDEKVEIINSYSPKIKIKPPKSPVKDNELDTEEKEESKGSLKMTITKQSDTLHSILKVHTTDEESCAVSKVDDSEVNRESHELSVPKLIIKSVSEQTELPLSPKMTTRSSKLVPNSTQRSSSPRITIKPIVKPENKSELVSPLKITISKSKNDDTHKQKHSPKSTRSSKAESDVSKDHVREHHALRKSLKSKQADSQEHTHSPRVTIKPIVKPSDEAEQGVNPKITIKPIPKPFDGSVESSSGQSPRVTIKPIVKPLGADEDDDVEMVEQCVIDKASPKITIKPVVKPIESEGHQTDFDESVKERIVLKINKSRKRELLSEDDRSEKLAKIKLKFSKEGGHPHIVHQDSREESHKRQCDTEYDQEKSKRQRTDTKQTTESHSKLKDILSCNTRSMKTHYINEETVCSDDVIISKDTGFEVSNDSSLKEDTCDPLADIPIFEITPEGAKTMSNPLPSDGIAAPVPKKRGRPRKVPLQIREDFKDDNVQQAEVLSAPTTVLPEPPQVQESSRPKRSCRGQSVRATLGIKPRKPRGASRGRGATRAVTTKVAKRGRGGRGSSRGKKKAKGISKSLQMKESVSILAEEAKLLAFQKAQEIVINVVDVKCTLPESISLELVPEKTEPVKIEPENTELETTKLVTSDIVMFEEETRMSADTSSRAQTPTKQMITCDVEESQSSVQSSATTESVKVRKGPRLEVHQEPEGAVISADQLAEYYWSGTGPFMLQEQVAQFLGIKSFKRKYPNIQRRTVDMQERDFIRESGLASEAMCDLGLTAVTSADILDIMYADFQEKYEEYCKHQRNRQAKDLINKQKALSLAASQEKNKLDITEQAVHSAAMWNASFNKVRREQRKACMDLQTMTVHYPKGRVKQIPKEKVGSYPVAVVPGQFTDYYKEFTPTEINNLPLNTMCYDPVYRTEDMECDSQSDDSGSGSDSSTSSSDSSDSDSSDGEDCKICNNNKSPTSKVAPVSGKLGSDKATSPQSKSSVQTPRTSGPVTRVTSARSKVVPAPLR